MSTNTIIANAFLAHEELLAKVQKELSQQIEDACLLIGKALKNGNKVLLIGNGGSAADAQHIAAEFTGRFVKERIPLPAIALTTDTSALTAISNDYGYDTVFARQITALGNKGDVLIAISTSGNSASIIEAVHAAKKKEIVCIGLSGKDGGILKDVCETCLVIPSTVTARIQEMHILIGHLFCEFVDTLY
ncbi:D-sedoheptulose 7-phosphate isomerase [Olivibacter sp. XZL3]|uniref:D-sedoheptulose 7-phosphate isomerase n=1 Tax=Olivibacter sp. XZL3 TaxID=1735116 RepID=UPI0010653F47|nr:D-sedoheptulose 7-phosphate isomerase [Olivibacter sp. XZL3]